MRATVLEQAETGVVQAKGGLHAHKGQCRLETNIPDHRVKPALQLSDLLLDECLAGKEQANGKESLQNAH